jgi:hypothetical protein
MACEAWKASGEFEAEQSYCKRCMDGAELKKGWEVDEIRWEGQTYKLRTAVDAPKVFPPKCCFYDCIAATLGLEPEIMKEIFIYKKTELKEG